MFDGLKDKLGSFREEAEEAADENAEPVDEEDLEEDAALEEGTEPEQDAALEEGTEPETAGDVERDASVDAAAADDPSSDAARDGAENDATGTATADDATVGTAEAADTAASDPEPADADATDGVDDAAGAGTPDDGATAASNDGTASGDAAPEAEDDALDAEEAEDGAIDAEADATDSPADDSADVDVAEGPTIVYPGEDEDDADASADESDSEEEDADAGDGTTSFTKKAKSFTRGKFVIEEEDLEGPLQDLEMALLAGDVEMEVAQELTDRIREELVGETRTFTTGTGEVVEDALRSALLDVVSVGQFDFDRRVAEAEKPVVIVFTGVNGVGKTTSIAKLVRYFEERGLDSVVANGDTFRAGANEQVEEHAENLDTKLIAHDQGGDPAAVIYDGVEYAEAHDVDVVLGDTAGRLHTSEGLMDQLAKIDRVVDPDMTIFVDEAVAGQDAVNRAREFDDAAEIDGSILTKADADASGGAAISIAQVTGKPILFLGTGQGYDDVERFDPEWLVDQLLEE